ncbi:hypothetical protein [Mycobacterium sp. Marseille-P9652]|uniref:hypothetical protein n=1 Tax=Mycobacterium sp. Marseille-P9652 TaxID=2654950 RepID=UPI0012E8FCF0|nr:hypothetical protein [Mycobacterium sp. Marseille-P9652]
MRICPTHVVRRALGLLGVAAAAAVVLIVNDVALMTARAVCTGLAATNTTNYGFFVQLARHGRSWNFREGLGHPTLVAA